MMMTRFGMLARGTAALAPAPRRGLASAAAATAQRKKMEAMASHMTTMADIVEKVSDLPTAPAAPSIPGIVENNKRRKEENFSALAATIQNMKRTL